MTLSLFQPPPSSPIDKYDPAYAGAKFDKSGYCLKHPMIRLCKPASNNGSSSSLLNPGDEPRYVIVRKICPMCGEHSLRNERKFNKQTWSHGYQQPEIMERRSDRGIVVAESKSLRRTSTASTAAESPPSSPFGVDRRIVSPHNHTTTPRRSRNLEDLLANGRKIPQPPVRDDSKKVPVLPPPARDLSRPRERDASVESRKARDVSAPRARLAGKVPYGDPRKREDFAASASALLEGPKKNEFTASAPSLLGRSESRSSRAGSRSRSSFRREDFQTSAPSLLENKRERSSSRHSRSLVSIEGSSKSLAARGLTRRHSTEVPASPGTRSVCNTSFGRRESAPVPSIYRSKELEECNRSLTTMKQSNSKHTTSDATASITSSEEDVPRGRTRAISAAPTKEQNRGRSKSSRSKIERHIESTFFGRVRSTSKSREECASSSSSFFSRGRSKSKSSRTVDTRTSHDHDEEERTIFSAGRSFANSLTRRRSLSRNASRVLKTTSAMDGNKDAEPCMQRYEVPFNPTTGGCNYHPEVQLAVRNGGRRGGWRIVKDCCHKCEGR